MVTLGSKRIHLVLTDSRGNGLQERIDKLNPPEYMEVDDRKGATLSQLIEIAEDYLPKHPFDILYVVGGVNDITTKDKATGKISYEWGNSQNLSKHLTSIVTKADSFFMKTFPASKVIFCPLIGSDLARVVTAPSTTQDNQLTVDNAIWDFNSEVFKINNKRDFFSPPLHHLVHRFCKGKRRAYYQHLHDGIHLSKSLKDKWATQFISGMARN